MNILFLSHYFPPEVNAPATRTYEHCKRWVRAGHQVTVVTCNPNHPHGRLYPGFRNSLWHRDEIDGIQVIRLWTFLSANKGFGLRTLNYVLYCLMCILFCWRFGRQDVVVSTSPQFFNGLAGYFVSRLRRLPWVLEIRDLWPESIIAVGAMRDGYVTRLLYRLELFCYRACDLIVPVTDAFKAYIMSRGIAERKIAVIKNGVDCERFSQPDAGSLADVDGLLKSHRLTGKFVAAYVGTHGMAHHLETVLEAAAILKDREDISFLLVGDGAERTRLMALAERRGLHNVVMLGQQPKHYMPALLQSVQASLVVLKKSDTFKSVIPSKMFESLIMAKPIILGVEGESAGLLRAADGGICIEPENAAALAAAVATLADDEAQYHRYSANGPAYVKANFDRNVLAGRYLAHLGTCLQLRPGLVRSSIGRGE